MSQSQPTLITNYKNAPIRKLQEFELSSTDCHSLKDEDLWTTQKNNDAFSNKSIAFVSECTLEKL